MSLQTRLFKEFFANVQLVSSAANDDRFLINVDGETRGITKEDLFANIPTGDSTIITFSGSDPDNAIGNNGDVWWKTTDGAFVKGLYQKEAGDYVLKYDLTDAGLTEIQVQSLIDDSITTLDALTQEDVGAYSVDFSTWAGTEDNKVALISQIKDHVAKAIENFGARTIRFNTGAPVNATGIDGDIWWRTETLPGVWERVAGTYVNRYSFTAGEELDQAAVEAIIDTELTARGLIIATDFSAPEDEKLAKVGHVKNYVAAEIGAINAGEMAIAQLTSSRSVAASDNNKFLWFAGSATINLTLPQESGWDVDPGFFFVVRNAGTARITLVRQGATVINGDTANIIIDPDTWVTVRYRTLVVDQTNVDYWEADDLLSLIKALKNDDRFYAEATDAEFDDKFVKLAVLKSYVNTELQILKQEDVATTTAETDKLSTIQLASDLINEGDYATNTQLTNGLALKENLSNRRTSLAGADNNSYPTTAAVQLALDDVSAGETFQGDWNADTNTPTLTSSTGTEGYYYQVTVAGTTTLDGISSWAVGDNVLFRNGVWIKREGVSVTSWAGKTGVVTPVPTDIVGFDDAVDTNASVATNTAKRTYPLADENKLGLIQAEATKNATDAALRDRGLHTGTQLANTISNFDTEVANNPAVEANTSKISNATHTGDVTGSQALTIANDAVTNAKLANMPTLTIKGRFTAGTGDPENGNAEQVRGMLNVEDGATADQTPAEIKSAYESNPNTNAFTDAEKTKLATGVVATADFNPNPYTGSPSPGSIPDGQVILIRP